MARGEHPPSCARRWRERAESEAWSRWHTVQAIQGCCGVSLLKAHRLAQGWTARVAIERLTELCEREHLERPQANIDLLNAWENGRARPRPETLDRLARLYQANAVRLGFAADYSEDNEPDTTMRAVPTEPVWPGALLPRSPAEVPLLLPDALHSPNARSTPIDEETAQRALFHDVLAGAHGVTSGRLLAEVERLRQRMDRTLATGTVTEDQVDRLDETVMQCRREYLTTPPLPMLCQLMLEFTDVMSLASQRQPGPLQRRLSHIAAALAILSADALMKLGDIRQARAWYGTAKAAADDTGDPRLRALVRAQEAMLPYYYGELSETVRLAREAQSLVRAMPCSPAALAAAAEGRALARMGDGEGASTALTQAQRLFSKIKERNTGTLAFDFSEQRLYLYLSGAHAHLPEPRHSRQSEAVHQRALSLIPEGSPGIDPALVRLDRAASLARSGQGADACELAQQTLLALPAEHRTSIVFVRARDVRGAIPAQRRAGRELRDFDEVLALDPSLPHTEHQGGYGRPNA